MRDATVVEAVEARMTSFESAQRALDAECLLSHFAQVPGFRLFNDGVLVTYEAMAGFGAGNLPRAGVY